MPNRKLSKNVYFEKDPFVSLVIRDVVNKPLFINTYCLIIFLLPLFLIVSTCYVFFC
jgi:hypothetical protein